MNNITYEGSWNLSDLKYVDIPPKDLPKYLAKKGDILFNRTNSKELVGKTAIFREDTPMVYAGYLIRARTNELAHPDYIAGYLNSPHGKSTPILDRLTGVTCNETIWRLAMSTGKPNEKKIMIDSDTNNQSNPDVIQPDMVRVLAAKSEAERLKIAWGMWRSAYRMVQRIVAMEFPNLSADEQQQVVARRMSHGT